jgi:hypothetical protein
MSKTGSMTGWWVFSLCPTSHHHHPLRLSIPLADQNRAWAKLISLLVKAGETGGRYRPSFFRNRSIQHLSGCVIEIAKAIGLDSIGNDCK